MRPRAALCLLAVLATAASLCSRSLRGRREQALSPSVYRRPLTAEEAARLALVHEAAAVVVPRAWPGLSPEDAARVAMAWPANIPLVSTRLQ